MVPSRAAEYGGYTMENRSDDFFLYPRARQAQELEQGLERLARLRDALRPGQQLALDELLERARSLAPASYLAAWLTPLEFFLLCAVIELAEQGRSQRPSGWIHPPFP